MVCNEMSRKPLVIPSYNGLSRLLKGTVSVVVLVVMVVTFNACAFARNVPDLPRQIQGQSSLPVLLEFYASWCATCQKMFPYVMEMKERTQGRLQVIRLDIDAPENRQWVKLFKVEGTPTYIVFNRDKKAVYIMEDMISSKLLETMVFREAGLLKPKTIPKALAPVLNLDQKPFTLIAYHRSHCKPCDSGRVLGATIEDEYGQYVNFVEVNADNNMAAQTFFQSMPLKSPPGYVLMDSEAHFIHLYNQPLTHKTQWQMLQLINMVVRGQPGARTS